MSNQIETISLDTPPIDVTPLVENGDSPVSIILALSIFVGVILTGISKLRK